MVGLLLSLDLLDAYYQPVSCPATAVVADWLPDRRASVGFGGAAVPFVVSWCPPSHSCVGMPVPFHLHGGSLSSVLLGLSVDRIVGFASLGGIVGFASLGGMGNAN